MRGQEKVFDKEELKAILENLAVAWVLIASLLMALYIIIYQNRESELQNTGMLANTLGGAMTALASAPDKGVYCVMLPGTMSYEVVLGKVTLEDGRVRSFVSAYNPEKGTTGISYLPVLNFAPSSSHVPSAKPYVVAFRKAGPAEPIAMDVVEGTMERAGCDKAPIPEVTPTSTSTPAASGIVISGEGKDITI